MQDINKAISKLNPMKINQFSKIIAKSFKWLMSLSIGFSFIKTPFHFLRFPYISFFEKKKNLAILALCFSAVSSSSAHATDYKRMAESLLKDAQQQMRDQEGEVQGIIEGTRQNQEKSFFGFDEEAPKEIFEERKPLKTGKTCHASSLSPSSGERAKYQGKSELFIFVTLGMSDENLKILSQQAQAFGGILVIRGLVVNSFQKTHKRLKDLSIPIDIDPTLFERFEVTRVPTVVLAEIKEGKLTGNHDKVRGNVSIKSALELFAMEGDLFPLAQSFLKKERKS